MEKITYPESQSDQTDFMISKRGLSVVKKDEFLIKYLALFVQNPYDKNLNPQGIINLGTSENALMDAEIEQKFNEKNTFRFSSKEHTHYFDMTGTNRFKSATVNFLQKWFSEGRPVDPSEIVAMNGVTACLDFFAMACCDPGDVIISATPVYGRIFDDFIQRSRVDVQPFQLTAKGDNGSEKNFELSPEKFEKRVLELKNEGKNVRGFILVNPQNPLGEIYSEDTVQRLLQICAKYKIHFISDEIYRLSIHDPNAQFKSVLAMELPDEERTHFTWGLSKDFSLAGIRCGIFQTKNKYFQKLFNQLGMFNAVGSIVQDGIASMLEDDEWCEKFIETNRMRLRRNFLIVKSRLESLGIELLESKAGLFAWFDLGNFLEERTKEAEIKLFQEVLDSGVYVVPGSVMLSKSLGWFRIVIAMQSDTLMEGLDRFTRVLRLRRNKFMAVKQEVISDEIIKNPDTYENGTIAI